MAGSPLDLFHPWVRAWFDSTFKSPTPPQAAAWPAIASGSHVLIHAPTGSGKTLAAFLWAINGLVTDPAAAEPGTRGVRVLYVSPLKALNYDIERNLRQPLSGISAAARRAGAKMPDVRVAVRTGDTPARERSSMVKRPPHILITTPESLYLMLGSPQTRRVLERVKTVIVDEIHAVCGSKRGAHLALSLERLERLAPGFQRIGLSATQRPLEDVARFLGGQAASDSTNGEAHPRPVRIVDAAYPKALDLKVLGMPEATQATFPGSIWPQLIPKVLDDVRSHRTTLIFCNSRMQAERTADRLNAESTLQDMGHGAGGRGEDPALAPAGTPIGEGLMGTGMGAGVFKAHHGSISEPVRRALEEDLKAGRLPALIGTSSLELGIDIGSIDLVVQLQSPKSVARGLQRIGRSGHLVGETSVGKIYATHNEDLLEAAVVGRAMLKREVEAIRIPRNPLDVLAQQVVAAVSVDDWRADDLFAMCRQAYPYASLPRATFDSVLRLVSGRYPSRNYRPLRARVYWDEASGLLTSLPGSRMHAMANGGTIVDRGEFAVYMSDGKTRLGELDEEFVWESRPGDVFTLGSQTWRALEIRDDRVIAEAAPGALPRMPFWKGEFPWRPFELSLKLAGFRRELATRLEPYVDAGDDPLELMSWLMDEYHLDEPGARQAIGYVRDQLRSMGTISSDRTVIVETYPDGVGDVRMVVHSPFGGKVNAGWAIALAGEIADRTGVQPDMQVSDDGIMFRLAEAESPVSTEIVTGLGVEAVRERLLKHLDDSPLFGALFRQNATRSLLMPVSVRGKRTPFWLQRRRAKDLLSLAREFPDFPVILETYRECFEDALDLAAIERVVGDVERGRIRVEHVESKVPSPVARSLNYAFTNIYLYEWDAPRAERASHVLQLDRPALAALFKDPGFAGLLRPEAIEDVVGQVSRSAPGYRVRSAIELAQLLEEAGDLNLEEIQQRCEGEAVEWLKSLERRGLVAAIDAPLPGGRTERRWIAAARRGDFEGLWSKGLQADADALKRAVRGFLVVHGPETASRIAARYRLPAELVGRVLLELEVAGLVVSGRFSADESELTWADPDLIARVQTRTLSILRREVRPVSPLRYAAMVRRRQGLTGRAPGADRQSRGPGGMSPPTAARVREVLESLRGMRLPLRTWNEVVFPARFGYAHADPVEGVFRSGDYVWVAIPGDGAPLVAVFPRASGRLFLAGNGLEFGGRADPTDAPGSLRRSGGRVFDFLRSEGTASSSDVRQALGDLSITEVRDALAEVVGRGLITADSWRVLGVLVAPPQERAGRGRGTRGRRESPSRVVARAVREAATALPPDVRWSAASRFAIMGGPATPARDQGKGDANGGAAEEAERARVRAEALADRYGVVTKFALSAEGSPWPWGPIVTELALSELRGKMRRGFFVAGLPGLQYGTREVIDELRDESGASAGAGPSGGPVVVVNASDPALALDRALFESSHIEFPEVLRGLSRIPSTWLAFAGDIPILMAEDEGRRIRASSSPGWAQPVQTAIAELRDRLAARGAGRVTVEWWNGEPVLASPGAEVLAAAGFGRDYPGMSFDQVKARSEGLQKIRPA